MDNRSLKTTNLDKLEFIHSAIQEAQQDNLCMLDDALTLLEDIREEYFKQMRELAGPIDDEEYYGEAN